MPQSGGQTAALHQISERRRMKMPAIMFSCAIKELEEAVDNKRPISSLMKQKWIDDAGGFVGDCETLLRLFCSESTDA